MISSRAKNIEASPTLALAAKAKELKNQGQNIISLSLGEPDWNTPHKVKSSAIEAINQNFTRYTPASGIPELKNEVAKKTNQTLQTQFSSNHVCITTGAKTALFSAFYATANPGDEIIIPAPYWVSYPEIARLAGLNPKIVSCSKNSDFKLTAELLQSAITEKTKLLLINSPNNPTGAVYSREELNSISILLKSNPQITLISDDIYNQLIFSPHTLAPHLLQIAPELASKTVIINGVSKSFAMTGWRIGWAIAPSEVIIAISNFVSQITGNACSISQKAALSALTEAENDIQTSILQLEKRRQFACSLLRTIKEIDFITPEGAFYIWISIENLLNRSFENNQVRSSQDFCRLFLDHYQVAAVPGSAFGYEGYIRLSYVLTEKNLEDALNRLKIFVSNLKITH